MLLCCNQRMNRELRAHLQSAAYVVFSGLALLAGWYELGGFLPWERWGMDPAPWWHVLTLAAMAGALAAKVRWPSLALVAGAGCLLAELSFGLSLGIALCLAELIYNQVLRAERRHVRAMYLTAAAVTVVIVVVTAAREGGLPALNAFLFCLAVVLVPLWWASEVRQGYPLVHDRSLREQLAAERERDLLAEHEQRRRDSVEAERRRMARELHDVVSSQVASIALTSGGSLHAEPQTERDRRALETIRTTSVEALDELRQMVRVLRGEAEEDGGAGELLTEVTWEQVLARGRAAGLALEVDGAPPSLPPAPRAVLLRVVQESLSNAAKHGDGTAQVRLSPARKAVRLRVESGLMPAAVPAAPAARADGSAAAGSPLGGGTGLVAMAERVQLIGGRLHAGEEEGRWVVEAVVPIQDGPR